MSQLDFLVSRVVLLDAGPLGMISHPRKNPEIKVWLQNLIRSGTVVRVPEIVDYEVRRVGLPRNSNYEEFTVQFMSNSYVVPILTRSNKETALITPARKEDMPNDWGFDWHGLWERTDFDCQNIVKLVYAKQVFGLIRYGLYPYPYQEKPVYLEIEQVQANPLSQGKAKDRIIRPIGKWLIWYVTRESLQKCIGGTDGTIAVLTAKDKESLIEYYSNTVQMEYQGPDTIAPGEDGHVFTFSRQAAEQFCTRQEQWGLPAPL